MPIEHVYIARVIDGLILVASMEQNAGSGNDRMEPYKQQAKQLLKRLNPRSTSKMSIESGSYTFHYMIDNGICYLSLTEKAYPKRLAFFVPGRNCS
jgi:vesicle transport protein SEC22